MDSAPRPPEVSSSSTAATSTRTALRLGVGMAHRARTQSVLAQHWSPSGLIGAVGRASVGFGLAVGRSQSIRPTVRYQDLNSAALRPSLELWHRHRSDGDPDGSDLVDQPGGTVTQRELSAPAGRPCSVAARTPAAPPSHSTETPPTIPTP